MQVKYDRYAAAKALQRSGGGYYPVYMAAQSGLSSWSVGFFPNRPLEKPAAGSTSGTRMYKIRMVYDD
jgi:hypothetical protein